MRQLLFDALKGGPVFHGVDRHRRVSTAALCAERPPGHSRKRPPPASTRPASPATAWESAWPQAPRKAGVSTLKIRSQTGHGSDAMLSSYVRDGELVVDNAAGALL